MFLSATRLALVALIASVLMTPTTRASSTPTTASSTTGPSPTSAPGASTTVPTTNSAASSSVSAASSVTTPPSGPNASTSSPTSTQSSTAQPSNASTTTNNSPASSPTGQPSSTQSTTPTTPTTTETPVCYNQNCTGNLTCLDVTAAGTTCPLAGGFCTQTIISNSTHSYVYTGCSASCEAVSMTAGANGYAEETRCCQTSRCNNGVIPFSNNGATSISAVHVLMTFMTVVYLVVG